MKRSTLLTLVSAIVLVTIAILLTNRTEKRTVTLALDGYASPEALAAEKAAGLLDAPAPIEAPIDEIILTRAAETLHFSRAGTGASATWRLIAPIEAPALSWPLTSIISLFKAPMRSADARHLTSEADLALFDLDPAHRIGLTLKSQGNVWGSVDLFIGQVLRADAATPSEGLAGTWVMRSNDPSTVFLFADTDLRAPLDKPVADFRDKLVFDLAAADLSRISITRPTGEVVTLEAASSTPNPNDSAAQAEPSRTWTLSSPSGIHPDPSVQTLPASLMRTPVKAFVAAADAPRTALAALEAPHWTLTLTTAAGDRTLVVSAQPGPSVWARFAGSDELMELTESAAQHLRQGLDTLRDRAAWHVPAASVTALTLTTPTLNLALERAAVPPADATATYRYHWNFSAPTLSYAADPTTYLATATSLTATRWARPDELEAARASLTSPSLTLTLTTAGATPATAQVHTLRLSAPVTLDAVASRWAVVGDPQTELPFIIPDFSAARLETTPDALRATTLLPLAAADITALTVTPSGASAPVLRLERPSTGGDLMLTGLATGETTHVKAVQDLLSALTSLKATAFHAPASAAAAALKGATKLQITIGTREPETWTLSLTETTVPASPPYARVDRGPLANQLVSIADASLKALTIARASLVSAAPLPEAPQRPAAP